jgi:hypothetical protein
MFILITICILFFVIKLYNKYRNFEKIPDYLKNNLLKLFFLYNDLYSRSECMLNSLCNSYPVLGKNRDNLIKCFKLLHSYFGNYILEPEYKNWILENTYVENYYSSDNIIDYYYSTPEISFTYLYKYINLYNDIGLSDDLSFEILKSYYCCLSDYSEKVNTEHSIIMKNNNNFLVYVCNGETKLFKVVKSFFKFLVIEYVCKNEYEKVCRLSIELNRNMYNEGNELLSSSFILWYLNHQTEEYYFNKYYNVNCMLLTGETITIGFGDFIKIEKNGFEVKKYKSN